MGRAALPSWPRSCQSYCLPVPSSVCRGTKLTSSPHHQSPPRARSLPPRPSHSSSSRSPLLLLGKPGGNQPQDECLHLRYYRLARALDEQDIFVGDHSEVPVGADQV